MGRPNSLAQTGGTSVVPGGPNVVTAVQYGAAGQVLKLSNGLSSGSLLELRSYNDLVQLTSIAHYDNSQAPYSSVQYSYPLTGANIGKIDKRKDAISGEE